MGAMRILPTLVVLALASGCSQDTDSEPPPTSPQASPSPSASPAVAPAVAPTARDGRRHVVVGPDVAGLRARRTSGLTLAQGGAH
jgi:hypothetical protein